MGESPDNLPNETDHDRTIREWADRVGLCHCPPDCDACRNRTGPCAC